MKRLEFGGQRRTGRKENKRTYKGNTGGDWYREGEEQGTRPEGRKGQEYPGLVS